MCITPRFLRGKTALHWAADQGNDEAVNLLLKAGANTNIKDVKGETPLEKAKKYEYTSTAKILAEYKQ